MFQEVLLSYLIKFKARATCEWQLSQQRLCWNRKRRTALGTPCLRLPSSAPCAGADPQVPLPQQAPAGHSSTLEPYHSVLVLLRGIVYGCVPSIGTGGVHFAGIQLPVPRRVRTDPFV